MRKIRLVTDSLEVPVGSFSVHQPLPTNALRQADPFLLLHHGGRQTTHAGEKGVEVPEHPHRGFEPVTFMFHGQIQHTDSLGNDSIVDSGEVQWITSGKGIMHEEKTPAEFAKKGGEMELIQLWVNLPQDKKMMEPAYQEIRNSMIPEVQLLNDKLTLRVVAGTIEGSTGPAQTQSPLITAMGKMQAGAKGNIDVTNFPTLAVYFLSGSATINGEHKMHESRFIVFEEGEGGFDIEVHEDGELLLLAGEPLNEPVVQYGPFVMNTDQEIRDAFRDLAGGKFGSIYGTTHN